MYQTIEEEEADEVMNRITEYVQQLHLFTYLRSIVLLLCVYSNRNTV